MVGGGPAGLEAARWSKLRGHQVTIFEKTGELGGAILNCCTVPAKNKMRWYADWLRYQVRKLALDVRLRTQPSLGELRANDVIVLATGGRVARPDIPGIGLPFVITFVDVLRCHNAGCTNYPKDKPAPVECGQKVLIWGDHFGAADTAERLGYMGHQVTVVTQHPEFASWMEPCHRDIMLKRFAGRNAEGLKGKTYAYPGRDEAVNTPGTGRAGRSQERAMAIEINRN